MRRLLSLLLMAALVSSACTRVKDPLTVVAAAADAARDQGSARFEMTMIMTFEAAEAETPFFPPTTIRSSGVVDLVNHRGRSTQEVVSGATPALASETIFDGQFVYQTAPPCPTGALEGKAWLKFDMAALGFDPSVSGGSGPTDVLESLRGVGEVETVGREEVRGVDTTRYRVQIDMEKALQQVAEDRREAMRTQLAAIDAAPEAEVWIDEDGLVRRMTVELDGAAEAAGPRISVSISTEFFDFGTPVETTSPPPEEEVFALASPEEMQQVFLMCADLGG